MDKEPELGRLVLARRVQWGEEQQKRAGFSTDLLDLIKFQML